MNPRYIPLIGVGVACALAVAFWFLLYQPRVEEQAALEEETAQLETQQQQLRNEIRKLEEIQASEEEYRADLARLDGFVPQGIAQPEVVRQFQETAKKAKVEIVSLTFASAEPLPEAPPTGDPETVLAAVPVTMVIEGTYFQAVDFFRRLEVDVPRALLVQNVSVTEGEDGFPALATTWAGRLFGVVPAPPQAVPAATAPADGEEAAPAEGDEAAPAEGASSSDEQAGAAGAEGGEQQ